MSFGRSLISDLRRERKPIKKSRQLWKYKVKQFYGTLKFILTNKMFHHSSSAGGGGRCRFVLPKSETTKIKHCAFVFVLYFCDSVLHSSEINHTVSHFSSFVARIFHSSLFDRQRNEYMM